MKSNKFQLDKQSSIVLIAALVMVIVGGGLLIGAMIAQFLKALGAAIVGALR